MSDVLVETCGGLGNQLFQIAAGLAYSWQHGRPVKFRRDWSSSSVMGPRTSHWHTLFTGLPQMGATEWAAATATADVFAEAGLQYRPIAPAASPGKSLLIRGYFQHRDHLDGQLPRLVAALFPPHLLRYAHNLSLELLDHRHAD